jgi:hypothetical protein
LLENDKNENESETSEHPEFPQTFDELLEKQSEEDRQWQEAKKAKKQKKKVKVEKRIKAAAEKAQRDNGTVVAVEKFEDSSQTEPDSFIEARNRDYPLHKKKYRREDSEEDPDLTQEEEYAGDGN